MDRDQISRILRTTTRPDVWAMMGPLDWAYLGHLMMGAVPDEAEARAWVREFDSAWADQVEAANRDATALQAGGGPRLSLPADHQAEAAMRGQALRVMAGLRGGAMQRCPHVSLRQPRPMFAASWSARVDCGQCLRHSQQPEPTPVQARTCDLCGRIRWRPVGLITPVVGPLTIGMGACSACITRLAVVAGVPWPGGG
jgi:hypothetical protein